MAVYTPTTDAAQLFMSLTIDYPAVTLTASASDTVTAHKTLQLTATPRNALGEPLNGLPAPTFHLKTPSDSTWLTVTPTGLLRAKRMRSSVLVVAELQTSDNIRRTDTAFVKVTNLAAPPTLGKISIAPISPDSAIRGTNFGFGLGSLLLSNFGLAPPSPNLVPQAWDTLNNPIATNVIRYTSLDSDTVVVIDRWTGELAFVRPGHARLVAITTAYGVTKVDTTAVAVTWPINQDLAFNVNSTGIVSAEATNAHVTKHGYVFFFWTNGNDPTSPLPIGMDVFFDDPPGEVASPPVELCDGLAAASSFFGPGPHCGEGDFSFPPSIENTIRVRQFSAPGVYLYHTSTGLSGRITVHPD